MEKGVQKELCRHRAQRPSAPLCRHVSRTCWTGERVNIQTRALGRPALTTYAPFPRVSLRRPPLLLEPWGGGSSPPSVARGDGRCSARQDSAQGGLCRWLAASLCCSSRSKQGRPQQGNSSGGGGRLQSQAFRQKEPPGIPRTRNRQVHL